MHFLEHKTDRLKQDLLAKENRIKNLETIALGKMKELKTAALGKVQAPAEAVNQQPDFDFLALANLDNRDTQTLLKFIPTETLLLALSTEDCADLRERIFSNVSSRAAAMLQEDLIVLGRISDVRVRLARQEVVCAALKLAAEDKIMLPESP